MPSLHNATAHDLRLYDLDRVIPAGGSLEVDQAEADRYDGHPLITVEADPAPSAPAPAPAQAPAPTPVQQPVPVVPVQSPQTLLAEAAALTAEATAESQKGVSA